MGYKLGHRAHHLQFQHKEPAISKHGRAALSGQINSFIPMLDRDASSITTILNNTVILSLRHGNV